MAYIGFVQIFLSFTFILFFYILTGKRRLYCKFLLTGILQHGHNFHKFHDIVANALRKRNGTLLIKGAKIGLNNRLFTSDPANIHHIMSTKFSNYVKGPEWRKRFDIFGQQSLFNADSDEWKHQRKIVRAFLGHPELLKHVGKIVPEIIYKQLIPTLDQVANQSLAIDMQDLFARYAFDFACLIGYGSNPNSLMSIGRTEIPFLKALDGACEGILMRHIFPEFIWKIQRWIGVGKEREIRKGGKIFDEYCANHMSIMEDHLDEYGPNALRCYLSGHEIVGGTVPCGSVIRDNITSLVFAAEDTSSTSLSWFFWLISKNPICGYKIREELDVLFQGEKNSVPFNLEQLNKLVYLHAAICESLRLFPPVPYESRFPIEPDTLPSGHSVDPNTNIVMCTYAMGRMTSIWGEDCREFKPERWIIEDGRIKHEPSHKFFAFTSGPRICPGKDIGFSLMKGIIATIIYNYDVEMVENHQVNPNFSIVLKMEHGLMAKIKKRWV